ERRNDRASASERLRGPRLRYLRHLHRCHTYSQHLSTFLGEKLLETWTNHFDRR
ncbi:hypothetical protein BGZ83_001963, partial [Gryganskiella cystojenkinii]